MFRTVMRRESTKTLKQSCAGNNGKPNIPNMTRDAIIKVTKERQIRASGDLCSESSESVLNTIRLNFSNLAPEYLLSHHASSLSRSDISLLHMLAIDNMRGVSSSSLLLRLAEFSARNSANTDYGLLDACIRRSGATLTSFSPSELIGLLSLCSRIDFVDSDFNEAVQSFIPSILTKFKDNQYPILFSALFRLGMDQPVDRESPDSMVPRTLPFMTDLISEIIHRLPNISESGCLTILHSILRKPRSRLTPETLNLVHAISDQARIDSWPLHLRVQLIHSLSRFGVENTTLIDSLFSSITRESIMSIPPQNLQHLLSIIHNHAPAHAESIWAPALDVCLDRLSQPVVAKTMPMAIIAVTLSYLGRMDARSKRGFGNLLTAFMTGQSKLAKNLEPSVLGRITEKSIERILTDPQVDIAHLTGIVEAIDRLGFWDMYFAVPLLLITRRLVLRDGIHNIRAAPLCQVAIAILNGAFGELGRSDFVSIDAKIDSHIASISAPGWSLINEAVVASSQNETLALLLEGLVKHEPYIRTTQSVLDKCIKIRKFETVQKSIPRAIVDFLDSLPEKAEVDKE